MFVYVYIHMTMSRSYQPSLALFKALHRLIFHTIAQMVWPYVVATVVCKNSI